MVYGRAGDRVQTPRKPSFEGLSAHTALCYNHEGTIALRQTLTNQTCPFGLQTERISGIGCTLFLDSKRIATPLYFPAVMDVPYALAARFGAKLDRDVIADVFSACGGSVEDAAAMLSALIGEASLESNQPTRPCACPLLLCHCRLYSFHSISFDGCVPRVGE